MDEVRLDLGFEENLQHARYCPLRDMRCLQLGDHCEEALLAKKDDELALHQEARAGAFRVVESRNKRV